MPSRTHGGLAREAAEVQVIERLARIVLAARKRVKADRAFLEGAEGALMREIAKTGKLSIRLYGCTFYAEPAKVAGSPSQRKQWRAKMPPGALPAWKMPRELRITYPERQSVPPSATGREPSPPAALVEMRPAPQRVA